MVISHQFLGSLQPRKTMLCNWGCYELVLPQFLSLTGAFSCFAPTLCRYKQATTATCKTADAAECSAWWRCCHSLIRFLGNSSHCSAFGLWCEQTSKPSKCGGVKLSLVHSYIQHNRMSVDVTHLLFLQNSLNKKTVSKGQTTWIRFHFLLFYTDL